MAVGRGFDNLADVLVFEDFSGNEEHVLGGHVVIVVVKAMGRDKMIIFKAHLIAFFVHHLNEAL